MKIKLLDVRLSFPDIFEAAQFQGTGPFNYGASFLFAHDHPATKVMADTIKAVATEKWGAKAAATIKTFEGNSQKCCYFEGDTKGYDGYGGNMAVSAKRGQEKGRPLVVDKNLSPLTAADGKPYAGCYVNAVIEIWAQDNGYGKGMRATLNSLQFLRDGDRFSSGSASTVDDFEDLSVNEFADDLV
jgi:hypothetical protein